MTFLLDVNVLFALIDPAHLEHESAHAWFSRVGHSSFATCPLTENALVRILGHPKYPNSPGPPHVVLNWLNAIRALPGHVFWPDSISIANKTLFAPAMLSSHARVTDSYLLALAQANQGRLATMDQRLVSEALPESRASLELVLGVKEQDPSGE